MNRQKKTTLFLFSVLEYREMEEYLEKMAAQGWLLEKVGLFGAHFLRIEPINLRFNVIVYPETRSAEVPASGGALNPFDPQAQPEQWTFLAGTRRFLVFCTPRTKNLCNLQSEHAARQKILQQPVWGHEGLILLAAVVALVVSLQQSIPVDYSRLLTNRGLVSLVYVPLLLLPVILYAGHHVWRLLLSQRQADVRRSLPRGTFRRSRLRGAVIVALAVLITGLSIGALGMDLFTRRSSRVLPGPGDPGILTLEDLGVPAQPETIVFVREGSLLVPRHTDYREIADAGVIRVRYIETRWPELSRRLFRQLLQEEGRLFSRAVRPAGDDWGQTDAYYLDPGSTMVMLRSGSRIWQVESHLDLSNELLRSQIQERLEI